MARGPRAAEPFVFRQARTVVAKMGLPTRYNEDTDELMVQVGAEWIPAVDSESGPRTKKADLETGEDQKDRW